MQRSTRRLLARVAVPLLAASVALAACGGSGEQTLRVTSDPRGDVGQPEGLDPAAMVREAANAPAEQGSMAMEMVIEADGEQVMSIVGEVSADGRDGDVTTTVPGMPGDGVRVLLVDGVYFYAFPGLPTPYRWVSMTPAEMAGLTGLDPSAAPGADAGLDGAAMLEMLSSISDDVEELGADELFDVKVTGYRATVSAETLISQSVESGFYTEELADAMSHTFPESIAFDIWIDDDGLPRRQTWSLDLDVPGEGVGTFDYRIDFPSWGGPIDVSAPSPEIVLSMEDLMDHEAGLSRD